MSRTRQNQGGADTAQIIDFKLGVNVGFGE